ncbi:hypothetical protein EVAR_68818_1 [Eumeta japonica]|uniref:Uncharacterized protein n=1 Tax=Eumeta variegata TaxID=151549 RepID=A0A4C1Z312_EUMVA|nr:hypothetical protein EVAR_68818_1 [Eumeta japonica]
MRLSTAVRRPYAVRRILSALAVSFSPDLFATLYELGLPANGQIFLEALNARVTERHANFARLLFCRSQRRSQLGGHIIKRRKTSFVSSSNVLMQPNTPTRCVRLRGSDVSCIQDASNEARDQSITERGARDSRHCFVIRSLPLNGIGLHRPADEAGTVRRDGDI